MDACVASYCSFDLTEWGYFVLPQGSYVCQNSCSKMSYYPLVLLAAYRIKYAAKHRGCSCF